MKAYEKGLIALGAICACILSVIVLSILLSENSRIRSNPTPSADTGANPKRNSKAQEPIWTIRTYVDDFGDITDTKYMTTVKQVKGTFSNSATTNSCLLAAVHVLKNGYGRNEVLIGFRLHEYCRDHPVKNFYENGTAYRVRVKTNSGEVHDFRGRMRTTQLDLSPSESLELHRLFRKHRSLRFVIVEDENQLSSYNFEVDATGYTATFSRL